MKRRHTQLSRRLRATARLVLALSLGLTPSLSAGALDAVPPTPGNDFYGFVNGQWLQQTALPPGRTSFDTSVELRQVNAERVRAIVLASAAGDLSGVQPKDRAIARMVGDYYASQADRRGVEQAGLSGLAHDLSNIAAIRDRRALASALGASLRLDDGTNTSTESVLGLWVHQGFHDPDHYAAHLVQGGLGLADREDYLDGSPEKAELRARYVRHLAKMFALASIPRAQGRAERVMALETAIARTHASRADTDDVFKTDNSWSRADFSAKAPGLDWAAFFSASRLNSQTTFVVWQPSAVVGLASLAEREPLQAWRDYLTVRLMEHYAADLPSSLATEHRSLVSGLPKTPPPFDRDRQAMDATNAALGEAIGRLYVHRYFSPEAKAAANAMVENIRAAFRSRITAIQWMSPTTKTKALAKLDAIRVGMGYPDRWTDVSALKIVRGQALANRRRAERFQLDHELAKLTQPVDPDEWALGAHSVNAIINFSPNSYQFSAGLLQPPYFDPEGDAACNYGSAGAGLAHEIWHSFDELGHIWDDRGRLGDWWSAEDLTAYHAAIRPVALQYGGYCPHVGQCVNGDRVLTESTADLIGLIVAHDAYIRSLNGAPDRIKDGLTGEQRFFQAFARRWRRVQTQDALRQTLDGDTHAPGAYRAAAVRNLDAWYSAFSVGPNDRLYLPPEQRLRLP